LPTLLLAVPDDAQARLQTTLFWRADMRRTVTSPEELFTVARTISPDLIVLTDAVGLERVQELAEQLRREPVTHDSIVIVLSDDVAMQGALEGSSVSLVLPWTFGELGDQAPWHQRLEELLNLRERGETRVLADFPAQAVISAAGAPPQRAEVSSLNLSSRGMLLETHEPLPRGARIELSFRLPKAGASGPEVAVIGEIVRTAETADGRKFAGIHFTVVRKDARLAIRDFLREQRPAESGAE
jgi:hypothetical protein